MSRDRFAQNVATRHRRAPLGQHFLRDVRYAERAVESADLRPDETVLEIGPGHGVLTKLLAPRVAKVVAVELDEALATEVASLGLDNVELVRGDAVKVAWPAFDVCVSNLPYQVSSPVLFRLLERGFRVAVLLVQKEFAERLAASPGSRDYGRLSVNAQRRATVEIVARVPPGAFNPPPQVQSAIVRLVPRPPGFEIRDEAAYEKVVEAAFGQRRKKLANALGSLPPHLRENLPGVPYADLRPEQLSPAQFAEVTHHLLGAGGA